MSHCPYQAQVQAERQEQLERAVANAARPSVLATPVGLTHEGDDREAGDGGGGGGGLGGDGSALLKAAKSSAKQVVVFTLPCTGSDPLPRKAPTHPLIFSQNFRPSSSELVRSRHCARA